MGSARMARQRRHTLHFLRSVRPFAPVFLDTEVDMTRVCAHREAETRYSVASYVLLAAGRVLARHPEANALMRGRFEPRIATPRAVAGKLTLDKTLDGRRVVVSAVLPGLERASLDEIQRLVEHYRDGDPATMPEFARLRALDRLPGLLGWILFRLAVGSLRRRPALMGTVAVTSLGHSVVDSFHSVGGTTITLGVGRIAPRPIVRDGELAIAPTMRLSLAFDHRVIDGAEAADVLGALREELETCDVRCGSEPETEGTAP
jgi:pyruvate/2-oxoglutarate dehydrogenase complex dihydrolipoamide acyltransferase (E2) component